MGYAHNGESAYFGNDFMETEVTVSIGSGKVFDLKSFYLSSQNPGEETDYTITTNNAGSFNVTLTNDGDLNLVTLPNTSDFQGITWFKITPEVGGAYMEIDDIAVENVKSSAPADIQITAFDAISNASAGTAGSATYANAAEVIEALPTTATANTGAVTVPVSIWVDS